VANKRLARKVGELATRWAEIPEDRRKKAELCLVAATTLLHDAIDALGPESPQVVALLGRIFGLAMQDHFVFGDTPEAIGTVIYNGFPLLGAIAEPFKAPEGKGTGG